MSAPFTVDGVSYNVFVPEGGIKRSGQVLDGDNANRAKSGLMIRDIIGTFYNYTIEIDARRTSPEEYDRLYDVLTAPVDYHTICVPYGQTTLTFNAYVSSAEDTLDTMDGGVNKWGGLSVNFIAMKPNRRA